MISENRHQIIIFSTLFFPALFLLTWWLFLKVYTPDIAWGNYSYKSLSDIAIASDGSNLNYTLVQSNTKKRNSVILFVANTRRDKNWNTKGLSPDIGERLATILGKSGYDSIRFDQRGTGDSRASLKTEYNISLLISDIKNIYVLLLKKYKYNPQTITVLAHGDSGCNFALEALKKITKLPARLLLINCIGPGSYLDAWGRRIFISMRLRGVPGKTIDIAKMEWKQMLQNNKIKEVTKKTPPDLATFRNTMTYFTKQQNRQFLSFASNIDPEKNIKFYIGHSVAIHHFQSEFDNEMFFEEIEYIKKKSQEFEKSKIYKFHYLLQSDHLLRSKQTSADHLFSSLKQNLNPFVSINPSFLRLLKEILEKK